MHHWCTVTADTFGVDQELRHMWRVRMPQQGYTDHVVMHGVLALAALHKAYLYPNQADLYLDISAHHSLRGSEGFRALLGNITNENWRSIFYFAITLVAYTLCLPIRSPKGKLQTPIQSMLELLGTFSGLKASTQSYLPAHRPIELYALAWGMEEAIINAKEE